MGTVPLLEPPPPPPDGGVVVPVAGAELVGVPEPLPPPPPPDEPVPSLTVTEARNISTHLSPQLNNLKSLTARASTAMVPLSSQDLIIMRTKLHPESSPGIEVVRSGDGPTSAVTLSDRPVLLES